MNWLNSLYIKKTKTFPLPFSACHLNSHVNNNWAIRLPFINLSKFICRDRLSFQAATATSVSQPARQMCHLTAVLQWRLLPTLLLKETQVNPPSSVRQVRGNFSPGGEKRWQTQTRSDGNSEHDYRPYYGSGWSSHWGEASVAKLAYVITVSKVVEICDLLR